MHKKDMSKILMGESNFDTEQEFDAYSQAICFAVANKLKEDQDGYILREITIWLKSGQLLSCPLFLRMYLPVFEVWNKIEKFKRRFFERIYNELTEDKKSVFANYKYDKIVKWSSGACPLLSNYPGMKAIIQADKERSRKGE